MTTTDDARGGAPRETVAVAARWSPWIAAVLLVLGAVLRLYHLDAMEFKHDEREALNLGLQLLTDHAWSSPSRWPTHGMLSSNGVPNAPLFNWIIAAAWAATRSPLGVATVIAVTNAVCLHAVWQWARRRTSESCALLTLAVMAASPFPVFFSRKIWTQDLLLPGVVTLLWGVEWLRGERPWRGVALLVLSVLLVGQLHQSGAIGVLLLLPAIGAQHFLDRNDWKRPWARPSPGEVAGITAAVSVNLFFWLPYIGYLTQLHGWLDARPMLTAMTPALLLRLEAQVVPVDLFAFFTPDRADFLRSTVRAWSYQVSVASGVPLLVYGLWRWLRSPQSIPVLGLWWGSVIVAFTVARIPSYPFYVLTLAPLPALLAAGAFDSPPARAWIRHVVFWWRTVYVLSLLMLTIATQSWLAERGGAAGDYGVTYSRREAQAQAIVRGADSRPGEIDTTQGARLAQDVARLNCGAVPDEVRWIVRWLDPSQPVAPATSICDGWLERGDGVEYRWLLRH